MNENNAGAGVLVMGELRHIENKSKRAVQEAAIEAQEAYAERDAAIERKNQLEFAAKSQIHGLRALIAAHAHVEDTLIDALKAANPNHPLASRIAVDAMCDQLSVKASYDSEVIKKTYPSGVVPDGAIPIVNGKPGVVGGQPAYPDPTQEQRLAIQEHAAMLKAAGLDGYTILDPVQVKLAIETMKTASTAIGQRLAEDDQKGFFGRMKKGDRAQVETDFARTSRYVSMLQEALVKAEAHHDNHGDKV